MTYNTQISPFAYPFILEVLFPKFWKMLNKLALNANSQQLCNCLFLQNSKKEELKPQITYTRISGQNCFSSGYIDLNSGSPGFPHYSSNCKYRFIVGSPVLTIEIALFSTTDDIDIFIKLINLSVNFGCCECLDQYNVFF